MKKIIILGSTFMMATTLLLTGCTKKEEPVEETATPEPTAEVTETAEPGAVLGGWQVFEENTAHIGDDDIARFEKAMEGLVGVGYEPLDVIATQVVSGTNYAYLAKGTTVTAQPEVGYYVVVVYENTQGEVQLHAINKIELGDVKVVANPEGENLVGAWEVMDTGKAGMLPGEDIQVAFDEAMTNLLGVSLNPIALLGTQVVNGTNYMVLSRGKTVTPEATLNLYVTTFNVNTEGKVEVLSNDIFDLLSYTEPTAE